MKYIVIVFLVSLYPEFKKGFENIILDITKGIAKIIKKYRINYDKRRKRKMVQQ